MEAPPPQARIPQAIEDRRWPQSARAQAQEGPQEADRAEEEGEDPLIPMLRYLHQLSGFFFYALGLSFFAAWLMLKNLSYEYTSAVWLQVGDLPLAFSAIIYGGLSVYLSLRDPDHPSKTLACMIGTPLTIFFGLILVMNFWS